MGTIFLAGIYGVGKSTLADKLSMLTNVPNYSAGDLISAKNGEQYGANKVVTDKGKNQDCLAESVTDLLKLNQRIILAGHFCIVNSQNQVDVLPEDVYPKLDIEKIILLQAAPETISSHLSRRDGKLYSLDLLKALSAAEYQAAEKTALKLSCPLVVHKMEYTDADATYLLSII